MNPDYPGRAVDVDTGTDDRSGHPRADCNIINRDVPLWCQKRPIQPRCLFVNLDGSSGTRKVENHVVRGQSSRQNHFDPVENEQGGWRRDVDKKGVSGAAYQRQVCLRQIDRVHINHI